MFHNKSKNPFTLTIDSTLRVPFRKRTNIKGHDTNQSEKLSTHYEQHQRFPTYNFSQGIVQNIGRFWQDHEYEDFEVNIEGENIRCHSFILASCSEFFKNLLKSNLKEKQEMKVDLQNIPLKTFQLILKTLYTGCDLLTKDNVLEVWSAVHQLQIHILVQHCEDFVIGNLSPETMETYRKQAELHKSQRVSERIFKYMPEDFLTLRRTVAFLRLDFKDVYSLIESGSLVVTSEDLVLLLVYEWVKYGEIMVNDYNTDPKTTSRNTSLTWVCSSKFDDSGKDIENSNVLAGNVNKYKKSKTESFQTTTTNNLKLMMSSGHQGF
uniref:BTB domain-containing protein n=1 Tax=Biomphalaria glabrata TaxID=6526 RepID=A0A2C9LHZ3_BIOGL